MNYQELYIEQRQQGHDERKAAFIVLDILTNGMAAAFDDDRVDERINAIIKNCEPIFKGEDVKGYSLDCPYYNRFFNTLQELIDDVKKSGMDPNYEVLKDGKPIGDMAVEFLVP